MKEGPELHTPDPSRNRTLPRTAIGEVRNGTQDWKGSSEAGDILAAQKPPCLCACNSLILGDRDSPIYAAQNHMIVGKYREHL